MALRSLNSIVPDRKSKKSMKKSLIPISPCPNDENLNLQLPLRPLSSTLHAPSCPSPNILNDAPLPVPPLPAPAPAPASEEPSADVEYILSEDLPDLDDAQGNLSTLVERLDSKDWLKVCEAMNNMRQLSIFHSSSLLPYLDKAVSLVIKAMKNPRSALCKTAIMASADLFKAYQDAMLTVLEPLLLQLLLKASQDKRFVCEEAERSLEGMTHWISPAPLMVQLQPYITHRNPRVRAKAAACVRRSVSRLGPEGIKNYGFRPLLQLAASQLNDQLPEARESARKLLAELYAAYPRQKLRDQLSDTASKPPNADESQEDDWDQFCSAQLSSHIAQAILRLTSAS